MHDISTPRNAEPPADEPLDSGFFQGTADEDQPADDDNDQPTATEEVKLPPPVPKNPWKRAPAQAAASSAAASSLHKAPSWLRNAQAASDPPQHNTTTNTDNDDRFAKLDAQRQKM